MHIDAWGKDWYARNFKQLQERYPNCRLLVRVDHDNDCKVLVAESDDYVFMEKYNEIIGKNHGKRLMKVDTYIEEGSDEYH